MVEAARLLRQADIMRELRVNPQIDVELETRDRLDFLANYLKRSDASGYVLGISGGVDSTVAGRLVSLACARLGRRFTAVRLPYGVQGDEADAQAALEFIEPDEVVTVNIKPMVDALHAQLPAVEAGPTGVSDDFNRGNTKARQRMAAQYAIAGQRGALVVGTDHAAEAVTGFFTKFGDGAADVMPLDGLLKRQVREIGAFLGAPEHLVAKVPTADLEDDRPGLPDQEALGLTYDQIDGFLSLEDDPDVWPQLVHRYRTTSHKRSMPAHP